MRIGFVELGFKLRFMLIFCLITLAAVSAASFLFYFLTYRELGNKYGEAFFTLQSVKRAVFPLLFASIQSISLLALVSLAIGILSLFFSHKIAGSLYRFEKSLEVIGAGDLTHISRLRTGDQIQELVTTINVSASSMKQRIKDIQDALARFKTLEEELNKMVDKGFHEKEIEAVADKLRYELNEIKRLLQNIKT